MISDHLIAYSDLNNDWVYFCDLCKIWHRHRRDSLRFLTVNHGEARSICPNRKSLCYVAEYALENRGSISHKRHWTLKEMSCVPTAVWLASSLVYFVQSAEATGPIKIGRTGLKTFRSRMSELQTASPNRLNFIGALPEPWYDEKYVHKTFSVERLRGEWFSYSDRLIEYIYDNARWWGK